MKIAETSVDSPFNNTCIKNSRSVDAPSPPPPPPPPHWASMGALVLHTVNNLTSIFSKGRIPGGLPRGVGRWGRSQFGINSFTWWKNCIWQKLCVSIFMFLYFHLDRTRIIKVLQVLSQCK